MVEALFDIHERSAKLLNRQSSGMGLCSVAVVGRRPWFPCLAALPFEKEVNFPGATSTEMAPPKGGAMASQGGGLKKAVRLSSNAQYRPVVN